MLVAYAVLPHGAPEPSLVVCDPAFAPDAGRAVAAAVSHVGRGRSAA